MHGTTDNYESWHESQCTTCSPSSKVGSGKGASGEVMALEYEKRYPIGEGRKLGWIHSIRSVGRKWRGLSDAEKRTVLNAQWSSKPTETELLGLIKAARNDAKKETAPEVG